VDQFVLGVSAWAQLMIASVYLGIADRALELAVASCCSRTSATLDGRTLAHHPMLQHTVAEMAMAVQGAEAVLQQSARDWSTGVDHGRTWIARLAGAKHIAVEAAKRVVDLALDVSGGAGMFKGNELERLYRDVRCGGFHPPNPALTHEIVGKTALGVLNTEAAMK
jgi:alkylation response protein AidB-like acyl-CoA dehydrogenase